MPPFDQNTNQPGNFSGGDFSGQLNDMLAPYQQMAQRMQSPYATMRPDSWLAKNHPQVAGILDNAFLTMGSTPGPQGPEGVGGGISRAMQGLMGGQQFRRQQMMQNMMMPYQMMMPQLQAKDIMSQIGEREAQVPFRQEQERFMRSREANYESMMAGRERQKALAGPDMTDDKGNAWSRVFDPVSGRVSLRHAVTGQDAGELPIDQQPTFNNEKKDSRRGTPGGLMGEIIDAQMSQDPAVKKKGMEMGKIYSNLYGQQAGARTGAEQTTPHPYADTKALIAGERQSAYATLEKVPSAKDWEDQNLTDPEYWKNPQKSYESRVKSIQGTKQQTDIDLAKYERSSAPRSGIGFQEYLQNRAQYDSATPTQAPPPEAANAPRAVDKAWTYKP